MFGSLLGGVARLATLPLDVADISLDIVSGGDGSRHSRRDSILSPLVDTRDDFADALEELD
jgi:hypothetical protein